MSTRAVDFHTRMVDNGQCEIRPTNSVVYTYYKLWCWSEKSTMQTRMTRTALVQMHDGCNINYMPVSQTANKKHLVTLNVCCLPVWKARGQGPALCCQHYPISGPLTLLLQDHDHEIQLISRQVVYPKSRLEEECSFALKALHCDHPCLLYAFLDQPIDCRRWLSTDYYIIPMHAWSYLGSLL